MKLYHLPGLDDLFLMGDKVYLTSDDDARKFPEAAGEDDLCEVDEIADNLICDESVCTSVMLETRHISREQRDIDESAWTRIFDSGMDAMVARHELVCMGYKYIRGKVLKPWTLRSNRISEDCEIVVPIYPERD
jgi:hypothetical protein